MRRLLTPRWLLVHLLAVAAVAAMLGLAWWQIGRARGGNALSIGYSLEWPVFAAFVVFVWVKSVRRELREGSATTDGATSSPGGAGDTSGSAGAPTGSGLHGDSSVPGPTGSAAIPPEPTGADLIRRLAEQRAAARASARADDPETAAYNHYLGWLKSHPHRPPSDYPGVPT